jgi:hypothetical protein
MELVTMRIKSPLYLFICIVSAVSAGDPHLDSCLANILKSTGLNIALDDSQRVVLRNYRLTKTENALGHTYWFAQTSLHDVPVYLQCFFENSTLVHVFISHTYESSKVDSSGVSKVITSLNGSLNACLHTSFDTSHPNGFAVTFDTATSDYQLNYSYATATPKSKRCGFSLNIVNTGTNHYKIREAAIDNILGNIKEEIK